MIASYFNCYYVEVNSGSEGFLGVSVEGLFRARFGGPPYRHQGEASEALLGGGSVVVRAPCGSGKTEAAVFPFLLGRRSALPKRLIYSLPTRSLVEDVAGRIKKSLSYLSEEVGKVCVSRQHGANPGDLFFKGDLIVTTIDQTVGAYCCTPLSLPVRLGNIPRAKEWLEKHVGISEYSLKMTLAEMGRKKAVGFTGWSTYERDAEDKWNKVTMALLHFAEYSNVGGNRTGGFER